MPIVSRNTTSTISPAHTRPDIVARARERQPIVASSPAEPDGGRPAPAAVPPVSEPVAGSAPTHGDALPYEVGYKRPPKHTRFVKGQSGNPKGRPKGAKGFNTIVRETMTAKIKIRTAKGRKSTTNVQALMMQALESALKGSQRDRHELLRYYREAIPDEPETPSDDDVAARAAEPEDIDAHDRAILERLRAKIIGELGGKA